MLYQFELNLVGSPRYVHKSKSRKQGTRRSRKWTKEESSDKIAAKDTRLQDGVILQSGDFSRRRNVQELSEDQLLYQNPYLARHIKYRTLQSK